MKKNKREIINIERNKRFQYSFIIREIMVLNFIFEKIIFITNNNKKNSFPFKLSSIFTSTIYVFHLPGLNIPFGSMHFLILSNNFNQPGFIFSRIFAVIHLGVL